MSRQIVIDIEGARHKARLNDTRIAELIWEALPVTASFSLWGEEIYFPIPVRENRLEKPQETVGAGHLGYWPDGHCFCIFYGPTPISGPGEIKPASAVEVIGRVEDAETFRKVKGPGKITIVRD